MYSMEDYRAALGKMSEHEIGSKEFEFERRKVGAIVAAMVADKNEIMVAEVVDEVYSLNECGVSLDDEAIQFDLWILENNGYKEQAKELRELDWK